MVDGSTDRRWFETHPAELLTAVGVTSPASSDALAAMVWQSV